MQYTSKDILNKVGFSRSTPSKTENRSFSEKFPNAKSFDYFKSAISLIEIAQYCGYKEVKEKTSRNYPCLEDSSGDRILIFRAPDGTQLYKSVSSEEKGNVISFVKNRLDAHFSSYRIGASSDWAAVNKALHAYANISEEDRLSFQKMEVPFLEKSTSTGGKKDKDFDIELFLVKPLRYTQYLEEEGISKQTLEAREFQGRILSVQNPNMDEGGHYNIANTSFPYYREIGGEIVGFEQRNTDFKGHALNSDKANGVWFSSPPQVVENIVICESAKDALSHFELNQPKNALYFSFGGHLTNGQVETIRRVIGQSNLTPETTLHLATDNDEMGVKYDTIWLKKNIEKTLGTTSYEQSKERLAVRINVKPEATNTIEQFKQQLVKQNDRIPSGKPKIGIEQKENKLKITLPMEKNTLRAFNRYFLEATGLSKKIKLDKANGKDWNEDLKEAKKIVQQQSRELMLHS